MNKFPLLSIYRSLAIIGAVLLVVGGVVAAIEAANVNSYYDDNSGLGAFIVTLLPFLAGAFTLGIVAELILLALRIEDHLEAIRHAAERQQRAPFAAAAPTLAQTPAMATSTNYLHNNQADSESSARKDAETDSSRHTYLTIPDGNRLNAYVNYGAADVRSSPDANSAIVRELRYRAEVTLYARTEDGDWVAITEAGHSWMETDKLTIDGNVLSLPVATTN